MHCSTKDYKTHCGIGNGIHWNAPKCPAMHHNAMQFRTYKINTHYDPSKCWEPLTQWHSITSQNS